jgi:hypothetical protein
MQKLLVRNTLDAMHIERNISANLQKHLSGEKDTLAVRRDMQEVGATPHLWLRPIPGTNNFIKPKAPYVFTPIENTDFINRVSSTRVPTGFSSTLTKHVGEKRLAGLKSHDHHVLLQHILPAAIRHSLLPGPRETIIRLGRCFQRICARVIDPNEMPALKTYVAETLCLMELWFPPGFFDITTHLVIHLIEEVQLCGPVHARWCYAVERYLGVLTTYVRDKSKPEASMATGYTIDESLGFCTEYFALYPHTRRRVWDWEEEQKNEGEVTLGKATLVRLTEHEVNQVHEYIITHSVVTAELYRYVTCHPFFLGIFVLCKTLRCGR